MARAQKTPTAGPWKLAPGWEVRGINGEIVCFIPGGSADAAVIVLAPDICNALKLAHAAWDSRSTKRRSEAWKAMSEILAKLSVL